MNAVLRLFSTFLLGALLTGIVHAQAPAMPSDAAAGESALVESARGLFKASGATAAENALFAANRSAPGSGAWFLESGQRLAWLAASFRNRKDPTAAEQAARRAIEYLATADAKLTAERKLASAARAQVTIARVYENLLFDSAAAGAAYTRALDRDPAAPAALAAMEKRRKAEEDLSEKLKSTPGK
jgi:hypothetical protein